MDFVRKTEDGWFVMRDARTGHVFYAPGPQPLPHVNKMFALAEWFSHMCRASVTEVDFTQAELLADLGGFPERKHLIQTCLRVWVDKGCLFGVVIMETQPTEIGCFLPGGRKHD